MQRFLKCAVFDITGGPGTLFVWAEESGLSLA
jgi:hypothetical protein